MTADPHLATISAATVADAAVAAVRAACEDRDLGPVSYTHLTLPTICSV